MLFREAAGADAARIPDPATFVDELGHRRDVHGPFLAWRGRTILPQSAAAMITPRHETGGQPAGADVLLWRALAGADLDVDGLLATYRAVPRVGPDAGALVPQGLLRTIEVWTETELSALHALSRLAAVRRRPAWGTVAIEAARWHVENLQPDNATNRPWSIHLFARLESDGYADAGLVAEALLHNCMVTTGRADSLSAQILVDAADAMAEGEP
jgi:hypothetical protein